MSAPRRELALPQGLVVQVPTVTERVEARLIDARVKEIADAARQKALALRTPEGKRRLASELIGPRKRRAVNARVRRSERRAAHEAEIDGAVRELPLGLPSREPSWLKRTPRVSGPVGDVTRYRMVEGPALLDAPWPVRYPIIDAVEHNAAVEAALRTAAYRSTAGDGVVEVRRYQESDADHRPVAARLDVRTTSQKVLRKALGTVCPDCGLNHRGEC